jgi:hypothetical protein
MSNPMTSIGDIIVGGSSGLPARYGIGSTNQLLTVTAGVPAWTSNPTVPGVLTVSGKTIATGHLGVGSASNAGWSSGFAVVDLFGGKGSFTSDPSGYIQVTQNLYNDGSVWRNTANAAVSMFSLLLNGTLGWYCGVSPGAPGTTWTPAQKMLLDSNTLFLNVNINTSNNLIFASTGQRILGDFSNATHANRVLFQTTTVNSNTVLGAIPNGTATIANLNLYGGSDTANAPFLQIGGQATQALISSTAVGTGVVQPLVISVGGTRQQFHVSGGVSLLDGTDPGAGTVRVAGALSVVRAAGGIGVNVPGDLNQHHVRLSTYSGLQAVSGSAQAWFAANAYWDGSTHRCITPYWSSMVYLGTGGIELRVGALTSLANDPITLVTALTVAQTTGAVAIPVNATIAGSGKTLGFYGTAGVARPTLSGSRGANAVIASMVTALAALGLVIDGTSA